MTDDPRPPAASHPQPSPTASSVQRLPELTRTAMWTTAGVIAVLTAAAVVALWSLATAGLGGADLVKARLDALKIGLSIGVGSGGVVALYLAWRRQHSTEADLDNRERALAQQYEVLAHQQEVLAHQQDVAAATQSHQERVADDARADAVERRITELYLKAVEQLGSDKAPVRLGGLYALERLAQGNDSQRQTIVNVLCAYLRMPFELPEPPADDADADKLEQRRTLVQECEVRLAAQRLLSDHLRPNQGDAYWGSLDLDLTGARLVEFTLAGAHIGTSIFKNAIFTVKARFSGTTFTDVAQFSGASFKCGADYKNVKFDSGAVFTSATFEKQANFESTTFSGDAEFERVDFKCNAEFEKSTFKSAAMFADVTCAHAAQFGQATFGTDAQFRGAKFQGSADFDNATFARDTNFGRAVFVGDASFCSVKFGVNTLFSRTSFAEEARFDEANFGYSAMLRKVAFAGVPSFSETIVNHVESDEVTIGEEPADLSEFLS